MSVCCDERCDIYQERLIKARKEHRCDACGGIIRPGHVYSKTAALGDGSWTNVIRCGRCETIYNHLVNRFSKEAYPDEVPAWALDCGHEYEERWDEPPPPEIAALAFLTDEEAGRLLEKKP